MDTFAAVIGLWPTAEALAGDLGLGGVTVRAWRNRNSIPPEYWRPLIAAGGGRGIEGLSLDKLAEIAEARRRLPAAQPTGEAAA